MTLTDLFISQITDLFRIALVIGLVLTMVSTRAITGTAVPLAAGVVFIALLIPMTLGTHGASVVQAIGMGLVVNAILLIVVLAVRLAVLKGTGR